MSNYGWCPHIESALRLKLADLFKRGAVNMGCTTTGSWQLAAGSWQWTRDGKRRCTLKLTSHKAPRVGQS